MKQLQVTPTVLITALITKQTPQSIQPTPNQQFDFTFENAGAILGGEF